MRLFPRHLLLGLACGLVVAGVKADDGACRIAFDMGSSGIRAGASNSAATAHVDIDYLGPQWAGRGLAETIAPTIAALRDLPVQAGLSDNCARIGGGFSAWRLAVGRDAGTLAADLARIATESGVPVLVIPQLTEGAYGYNGARQALGGRLTTSHVLDIGGGSMQIAGERRSFGAMLGQKAWHRELCTALRGTETSPCNLQPLSRGELAAARRLLAKRLVGVRKALRGQATMTAISRPVTRGVAPAVARVIGGGEPSGALKRRDLTQAIDRLAADSLESAAQRIGSPPKYAAYVLSDMLLVEGLMRATGSRSLQVAEIDLTNIPGLLADDRAYAWGAHYDCYLGRLRALGVAAYASDPASCPSAVSSPR